MSVKTDGDRITKERIDMEYVDELVLQAGDAFNKARAAEIHAIKAFGGGSAEGLEAARNEARSAYSMSIVPADELTKAQHYLVCIDTSVLDEESKEVIREGAEYARRISHLADLIEKSIAAMIPVYELNDVGALLKSVKRDN